MAKEKIFDKKKEKVKPKYQKVKIDKKNKLNLEEFFNKQSCPECPDSLVYKICEYCGRADARGHVRIQNRMGFVEMERLWATEIKFHNRLSIEEQEEHSFTLHRTPYYLLNQ